MREYDEITSGTGDDGPERSRRPPPGAGRLLAGVAVIAALTVLATGHGPRLSSVEERPQPPGTPVRSKASTPPAPVAAPAPSPTNAPTTYPPDLGESGPPGVAFAVGSVIHDGDRLVGLPEGWRVNSLWTVPGGWLVSAKRLPGPPVLAKVDHSGAIRDIGTVGLVPSSRWTAAVDPRGTRVAWASTSGQGRFRLRVSDTTTGELRFSMRLPFPPLFHDWVRGKGPLVSPALHPEGAPVVVDLRTRRLRPVVNAAAGPQPGFIAYSPRSDHLVLSRVLRAEFDDTCRPLSKAELPVRNVTCRASRGLGAFSPGGRNGEHLAVSSLSTIDVRLPDGGKRRVFRGPGSAYVEQLIWEDRRALLAALVYIRNGTSLVLRCTVEGGCRRAYQPSPDEQVVLARR